MASRFAKNFSNLLFQFTYTAFTGIRLDDCFQRILWNLDIALLHTVCFQLFRNQVATGNFYLFFGYVAAYFNQLHTVEQRPRNCVQIIGGSNEHHLRQVIIHIQEVVVERSILFRIKHFEQSGRRVALTVGTHLVYLVQYKYGIGRTGFNQTLDNTSGHCSDIRLAVSAYFRFIMYATQGHTDILPLQSSRYRAPQRGLTHTRRTIQTDDRRLHISFQLQYGKVLQYTLFYLLQAVMVFIQRLLCISQVQIIRCINAPRQTHHSLQVVQLHTVIGRLRMHALQLIHFFQECTFYFFIPFYGFSFFAHFFQLLLLAATTQFILNGFNLLLQEIFALLLVYILAGAHLDRLLNLGKLHFPIQNLKQAISAGTQCVNTQQLYLFILLQGQIGTDKIYQKHRVINVFDGKCRILRKHFRGFYVTHGQILTCFYQCLKFLVIFSRYLFIEGSYTPFQIRSHFHYFFQLNAFGTLQNNSRCLIRHFQYTDNLGNRTDCMQVLKYRLLRISGFLTHYSYI